MYIGPSLHRSAIYKRGVMDEGKEWYFGHIPLLFMFYFCSMLFFRFSGGGLGGEGAALTIDYRSPPLEVLSVRQMFTSLATSEVKKAHKRETQIAYRCRWPWNPLELDLFFLTKSYIKLEKGIPSGLNQSHEQSSKWNLAPIKRIVQRNGVGYLQKICRCIAVGGQNCFNPVRNGFLCHKEVGRCSSGSMDSPGLVPLRHPLNFAS